MGVGAGGPCGALAHRCDPAPDPEPRVRKILRHGAGQASVPPPLAIGHKRPRFDRVRKPGHCRSASGKKLCLTAQAAMALLDLEPMPLMSLFTLLPLSEDPALSPNLDQNKTTRFRSLYLDRWRH